MQKAYINMIYLFLTHIGCRHSGCVSPPLSFSLVGTGSVVTLASVCAATAEERRGQFLGEFAENAKCIVCYCAEEQYPIAKPRRQIKVEAHWLSLHLNDRLMKYYE